MKTLMSVAFTLASAAALTACSDVNPAAPVTEIGPPQGILISNPTKSVSTGASVGALGGGQAQSFDGASAYVSAVSGTLPDAVSGSIQNQTAGGPPRQIKFTDGGFDPVGIAASAGDELSLTYFPASGDSRSFVVKVPSRRPPEVVRTEPAKDRTDVARTVQVQVVFSEPVDKLTVTAASIALFDNGNAENAVSARITTSSDGLSVLVTPDVPLAPGTNYTLGVTGAVHDLDGDASANLAPLTFTTEAGPSPDIGGELVFLRLSDRQIYTIGVDGQDQRRLTNMDASDFPSWSPNGDRIAFTNGIPVAGVQGSSVSDVYIMSASGSDVIRRTRGLYLRSAVWSPDGKTLAVSDEGLYYGGIWTISSEDDGREPVLIANDARTPAWSPDGRRIAFIRLSHDDGYHQIFVMDPDGKNVAPLTELDEGGIYGLTWSPDGSRLAFGKCLAGRCEIYVMNKDGSDLHPITNGANGLSPTWSPDGKFIAFMTSFSAYTWHPSLAYVSSEGGTVRKVIDDALDPSWRPLPNR